MSTTQSTNTPVPDLFASFLDDAALFPPGGSPLDAACHAWHERESEPWRDLVASFVVTDLKLPEVAGSGMPLSVVVTGGAGALAGVTGLANRAGLTLHSVDLTVRDLDDPVGNVRRFAAAADAARQEGTLSDETLVHVEIPLGVDVERPADAVAETGLRLKFRTGGVEAHHFPTPEVLAGWIDAALDRETPFKCTAGLHRAVAHTDPETGFAHHGFLNVLLATRVSLDTGDREAVVEALREQDGRSLGARIGEVPVSTRNWFTRFGTCSVTAPRDDLRELGLIDV